ncbi:MAG: hypothetical protein HRU38_09520 [Saccharospirillaceae bacterium]|nr:hypothetical protein [Saccharospirillaceae bacterium]
MRQVNNSPPNKHVMAAFTFVALLPLVYFIPPWVAENISDQHVWVTLISVASIVPIISYVLLTAMLWWVVGCG